MIHLIPHPIDHSIPHPLTTLTTVTTPKHSCPPERLQQVHHSTGALAKEHTSEQSKISEHNFSLWICSWGLIERGKVLPYHWGKPLKNTNTKKPNVKEAGILNNII